MTETQRNATSYAFVALCSGALLLWIIPAFSPEYPGYGAPPTLVPNVAACLMLVLALLGLTQTALRYKHDAGNTADGVRWRHLFTFFVPCGLMMPAMHYLGFIPAGLLFMLVIQIACGQRRIVPLALVAALPVLAVYLLMRFVLGVPMP